MPNWIEGTMKVRGKADALMLFVENTFDGDIHKDDGEGYVEYTIPKRAYIQNSRRAFTSEEYDVCIEKNDRIQTIPVPIKQAWSFTPSDGEEQRWIRLAKEYGVDIRLQGFERGIEFYQDLAIVNGEITIDDVIEYDDWNWECPMPNLGG